jgi:hypothetical protein
LMSTSVARRKRTRGGTKDGMTVRGMASTFGYAPTF